jgi:hypothetical protein
MPKVTKIMSASIIARSLILFIKIQDKDKLKIMTIESKTSFQTD